jgi:hypothetical protein
VKIPSTPVLRDGFYRELIDQCFASRSERVATYDRLKSYYLWGTDQDDLPVASKLYSALDNLNSYMYSPESTRFTLHLGAGAPAGELPKTIPMRDRLMDEWHDTGADIMYGDANLWALVYNSMFLYPQWRKGRGIEMYVLEPHNVGVLREDRAGLDRQEAYCIRYSVTTSQLLSDLEGHPKLNDIMTRLASSAVQGVRNELPSTVQRIITSAVNPSVVGQAVWWTNPQSMYSPKVQADMVEMYDLWVWNDAIDDYQRVTRSDNEVTIWDRPNTFLPAQRNSREDIESPGEHPLVQICPLPQYNYFWGRSMISHLLNIQDAWAHRIQQMQRLGDKIVDPPKRGYGVTFDSLEAQDALFDPHGWVNMGEPNSKIDDEKISVPAELWEEIAFYDALFNDQMGINNVMQGKGESGVRSRGQTDTLARLGSSRAKNRAMIGEDSLDRIATKMAKLLQRHDTKTLRYEAEGREMHFVPSQFTNDYTAKVDSHTMSPIFVEDEKNLAFSLLEAKAITRERLLEMVHPVMLPTLKHDLKGIEAQEAAAAKAEQQKEASEKLRSVK